MARILTRNWFWILATTIVPLLWQVLAAPQDETAGVSAKDLKAAHAICERLDPGHC